jgi:competence protein ComEC
MHSKRNNYSKRKESMNAKWFLKSMPWYCFVCSVVLVNCQKLQIPALSAPAHFSFLSVGQGDALLLEGSCCAMMVDVGKDSMGIVDTLRNRRIDTLDWVVITHLDRDHFGGMLEILTEGYPAIKKILIGPDSKRGYYQDSLLRLLDTGESTGQFKVESIARGDTISMECLKPFRAHVLWPPLYSTATSSNEQSLVLRLFAGEHSLLLMADADTIVEEELVKRQAHLETSILKVGHHGSATSSSLLFLATARPEYAVISSGANPYGHPHQKVIANLLQILPDHSTLCQTALTGSCVYKWSQEDGFWMQ